MTSSARTDEQRARERELLALIATSPAQAPAARAELVAAHQGLVRHLARKFAPVGDLDDLVQAGNLGLLTAIDAYDPSFDTSLATFATKHIAGEMRRHLGTQAWAAHVPRRVQDLAGSVRGATQTLTMTLGRHPTVPEIAAHLGVDTGSVLDALEADHARIAGATEDLRIEDHAGDAALRRVEDAETVRALLSVLPERERDLVTLMYFDRLGQEAVAERLGISQAHVSRLHRRAMDAMRTAASA